MGHKNDYTVIVKVSGGIDDRSPEHFKKWRFVHDLLKFTSFLDLNYPRWRYMNVYDRRKGGSPIVSYTQKNRPLNRFL